MKSITKLKWLLPAVGMLALTGCGGDDDTATPTDPPTPTGTPTPTPSPTPSGANADFRVTTLVVAESDSDALDVDNDGDVDNNLEDGLAAMTDFLVGRIDRITDELVAAEVITAEQASAIKLAANQVIGAVLTVETFNASFETMLSDNKVPWVTTINPLGGRTGVDVDFWFGELNAELGGYETSAATRSGGMDGTYDINSHLLKAEEGEIFFDLRIDIDTSGVTPPTGGGGGGGGGAGGGKAAPTAPAPVPEQLSFAFTLELAKEELMFDPLGLTDAKLAGAIDIESFAALMESIIESTGLQENMDPEAYDELLSDMNAMLNDMADITLPPGAAGEERRGVSMSLVYNGEAAVVLAPVLRY